MICLPSADQTGNSPPVGAVQADDPSWFAAIGERTDPQGLSHPLERGRLAHHSPETKASAAPIRRDPEPARRVVEHLRHLPALQVTATTDRIGRPAASVLEARRRIDPACRF